MVRIRPNFVVTFYGPLGIFFARIIRLISKEIPLISILNLAPSALDYQNNWRGWIGKYLNAELNNYRKTLNNLSKIICASSKMQTYVNKKYGIQFKDMFTLPDYFHRTLLASSEVNANAKFPSVIFLGAPERWGGQLDRVDDQFIEMARLGIDVYSGQMSSSVLATGKGHLYPYFSEDEIFSGEYSRYISRFPIAIITYGVDQRHQRFMSTLPTRFFSALAAGLPVAVRAGIFDAVEDYIKHHGIGFIFTDAIDLKCKLINEDQILSLRKNALHHSKKYFAEAQADEFKKIIDSVLSDYTEK
jgi:hypothetical protein